MRCSLSAAGGAALDAAIGLLPPPVALIASLHKDAAMMAHGDGGAAVTAGLTGASFVSATQAESVKNRQKKNWWRRVAKVLPGVNHAITAVDLAMDVKSCYVKHCK
jgi:hypothetical protein